MKPDDVTEEQKAAMITYLLRIPLTGYEGEWLS